MIHYSFLPVDLDGHLQCELCRYAPPVTPAQYREMVRLAARVEASYVTAHWHLSVADDPSHVWVYAYDYSRRLEPLVQRHAGSFEVILEDLRRLAYVLKLPEAF